ncbi:alpha/beta hydrolase [Methyloceanibacter methanicus]|nr:alpha/beta hydrolase [Methyloceanibacter methanicus]
MLNLFLALLLIFALFCLVARLLHRYFVYVPDRRRIDPREAGIAGVEEIVFKATDGKTLIAWYRPAEKGKRTLLYFPGNSGSVAARAGKIKTIAADGYGVFIVNYRGYGGSGGRPTEKRLVKDAVSAFDTLRGLGVPPRDIVVYGESLGTGVATQVCLQREAEALVLESPFTSVVDVGKLAWPLLPLKQIMVDQYRTIDRIGSVNVPLFIVHGGRDAVIPLDMARRVFHAAHEPKTLTVVPRAGHNDLFEQGAWARVRDFVAGLPAEAVPAEAQSAARAGRPVEIQAAAAAER